METGLWLRHLVMACHPDMDNALIQLIVEQGMSIIPDDRLFVTLVVKCLMVHAGKQIPSAMCCLRLVLNLLKISLCFLENFLKAKHSLRYQNPWMYSTCTSRSCLHSFFPIYIPFKIIIFYTFDYSKIVYVWHVTRPSEQAKFMLFMVMRGLVAYSQYKNCHILAEFAIATITTITTTIMTLKITK